MGLAALAVVVVAAGGAAVPKAGGGSPAGLRLYVPNQSSASVSILDARTARVITTVDLTRLGFGPNAKPHHVVVAPSGEWYVSLIGENLVVKFDPENRVVGRSATETPGMLALDPAHDRLYASRSMTAVNAPSSIAVIRASDMTVLEEVDVLLPRPHALTLDRAGNVYVGGLGTNQVATVDPNGRVYLSEARGGVHAFAQFAVSPDGRWLVATGHLSGRLVAFDATNPRALREVAAPEVGAGPYDVSFSPDGRWVWTANQRANSASAVEAGTWRVLTIRDSAFAEPHGVAVSPDGSTVFISNHGLGTATPSAPAGHAAEPHADSVMAQMHNDRAPRGTGTVLLIDAASRTVREVVPVGRYAAGLGLGASR